MIKINFTQENFSLYKKLEKEGYLTLSHNNDKILINLKSNIKIKNISKPSRKIYYNWKEISKGYKQGLGTLIIRTTQGYKTDIECIKERLGGRAIIKIF